MTADESTLPVQVSTDNEHTGGEAADGQHIQPSSFTSNQISPSAPAHSSGAFNPGHASAAQRTSPAPNVNAQPQVL